MATAHALHMHCIHLHSYDLLVTTYHLLWLRLASRETRSRSPSPSTAPFLKLTRTYAPGVSTRGGGRRGVSEVESEGEGAGGDGGGGGGGSGTAGS